MQTWAKRPQRSTDEETRLGHGQTELAQVPPDRYFPPQEEPEALSLFGVVGARRLGSRVTRSGGSARRLRL